MTRYFRLCAFLLLCFLAGNAFSQDSSAVQFSYNSQRLNDREVLLTLKGKIAPGIKLFALQKSPGEIMYSSIRFDSSLRSIYKDSVLQKGAEQKTMDPALQSEVYFFTDSVEWQQKINASLTDSFLVKGTISYMYQEGVEYLPKEEEFQIFVLPEKKAEEPQIQDSNSGVIALFPIMKKTFMVPHSCTYLCSKASVHNTWS